MIRVNFNAPIRELNGEPALQPGGTPLTLKEVSVESLLTIRDNETIPAMEKVRRAKLAYKIYDAIVLELSSEDVAYIKEQIGKDWGPLAVYQAWDLLDKGCNND